MIPHAKLMYRSLTKLLKRAAGAAAAAAGISFTGGLVAGTVAKIPDDTKLRAFSFSDIR